MLRQRRGRLRTIANSCERLQADLRDNGHQRPTMTDFASSSRAAGRQRWRKAPLHLRLARLTCALETPAGRRAAIRAPRLQRWLRKVAEILPPEPQQECSNNKSTRHVRNADAAANGLTPRAAAARSRPASDLDHLEVFLARAAFGAGPVDGHIFPARAGRNAFVWQTGFFVVDPAADQTHPAFIFHSYTASKSPKNRAPRAQNGADADGRENCQVPARR